MRDVSCAELLASSVCHICSSWPTKHGQDTGGQPTGDNQGVRTLEGSAVAFMLGLLMSLIWSLIEVDGV